MTSLRATLDLQVAALHRVEVERGGIGAGGIELAAPPPMPCACPGTELHEQRACGKAILLVCVDAFVPRPPAIMIGLW